VCANPTVGFIWGAFSIINIAFVFYFVPEMKGLSLEQLDYLYEQKTPTRKFRGYHFDDDILATGHVDKLTLGDSGSPMDKEAEGRLP
jgi:SP family sugar:H+ symporter-like MFS transporter